MLKKIEAEEKRKYNQGENKYCLKSIIKAKSQNEQIFLESQGKKKAIFNFCLGHVSKES